MTVRELTAEDRSAYRRLSSGAFGGPVDDAPPAAFDLAQIPLGIDSAALPGGADGVIAAGARIRRDRITVAGGVADCGGIGGLAVHPAHRGDGLFRTLLTGVIARCAAEGMAFSMLYPSNPEIYRRLGYQVVAAGARLIVPLVDLQRLPAADGRRLMPVTEETMPRVRALYRELTAGDNAMLRRDGPLFPDGMPGGGWEALLLVDADGRDHGYLSFTRTAGAADGVGLEVHEIFGRTRADRVALLRSVGSWSTVTQLARLRVRTEDPVLDALPGGNLRPDPGTVPLVMMRVIDTAAALEARPAPAGLRGSVRLEVADTTVDADVSRAAGCWTVTADGGRVTVTPATPTGLAGRSASAPVAQDLLGEVHLDIHAASLLLTGGRALADARRLDLTAQADPDAEAFLDTLLAGPRPSVLDAF